MEPRTILHCDLNSYFASVECLTHPEYRDVPMIVGGETEQRHGIVLAKNEYAKRLGIQTGESVYQARAKCPSLVVCAPRYDLYLAYSRQVREIYRQYTDQVEAMGIDECWLDVTASRDLFGDGRTIAEKLRRAVRRETGLTISVGVSFNKIFSKLGSDLKKPDAVTEIPAEGFQEIVWPLPAYAMMGVGMPTYKKLYERGCRTIGDIVRVGPDRMQTWLGKMGRVLWVWASGLDTSRVLWQTETEPIRSIGHGTTTIADLQTDREVACTIASLTEEIGTKLRQNRLTAGGVAVQVRENDLVVREYQEKLPHRTQLTRELTRAAVSLFRRRHLWRVPIRSLTVRAISIADAEKPEQLDLFSDPRQQARLLSLEETVDRLRSRYGERIVQSGTCMTAKKLSAQRIGYGIQPM